MFTEIIKEARWHKQRQGQTEVEKSKVKSLAKKEREMAYSPQELSHLMEWIPRPSRHFFRSKCPLCGSKLHSFELGGYEPQGTYYCTECDYEYAYGY